MSNVKVEVSSDKSQSDDVDVNELLGQYIPTGHMARTQKQAEDKSRKEAFLARMKKGREDKKNAPQVRKQQQDGK